MQQQMDPQQNGRQSKTNDRPHDEIDIYNLAIASTIDSELIDDVLLGLGNYSSREYWQQVDSFRKGVFSTAAFTRRIRERAIEETKVELALNGVSEEWEVDQTIRAFEADGWHDLDEETQAEHDRRRWIDEKKEEFWEQLPEAIQFQLVAEIAGLDKDWKAPHIRMMMMRHEASRSKEARLMDNLFGRIKEHYSNGTDGGSGMLERLRGGNQKAPNGGRR
jgi:hypothetical protein